MRRIPDSVKTGFKPALLTDNNGTILVFPIAPQRVRVSRQSEYSTLTPLDSSDTYHEFVRCGSEQVQLGGIILNGIHTCSDVTPFRESLDRFMVNSSLLTFSQGKRVIDRLLVSNYDWEESEFSYGFPVYSRVSIDFLVQAQELV